MKDLTPPRKQKRVLLVDLGASMGGVESYLVGLATILQGHVDVHVLCVLPELEDKLILKGARVTRIPILSKARPLRFLLAFLISTWEIVYRRIDIVQVNGFLESLILIPARLLNREAIYTRHGPFETDQYSWYRQPLKLLPRLIARFSAHFATRLICVSETVGSICRPLFPNGRVTVIANWVAQIPEFREPSLVSNGKVRIIYVGRLEEYKGVQLLLEAMRNLSGVSLTVVGDGKYRETLQYLAAGLDATFVGFHKETREFYQQSDIFVMPSMGPEGLPMVTLEAMSHGLPCLFSDLPVHSEITDRGHAALLFRSGDVHDLRSKLEGLVGSAAERARLARNAYQMVQQRYDVSIAQRAYLQIFGQGAEFPASQTVPEEIGNAAL